MPMPGPQSFKDWLDVLGYVWMALLSIAVWVRKPGEAAGKAVDDLARKNSEEHSAARHRLTKLEERIQHMPTAAEIGDLKSMVGRLEAQVEGQRDMMLTVREALRRIEDFLLSSGHK